MTDLYTQWMNVRTSCGETILHGYSEYILNRNCWVFGKNVHANFKFILSTFNHITRHVKLNKFWNFCGFCIKVLYTVFLPIPKNEVVVSHTVRAWTAGRMLHTRGPIARVMSCTGTNRRGLHWVYTSGLKPQLLNVRHLWKVVQAK